MAQTSLTTRGYRETAQPKTQVGAAVTRAFSQQSKHMELAQPALEPMKKLKSISTTLKQTTSEYKDLGSSKAGHTSSTRHRLTFNE